MDITFTLCFMAGVLIFALGYMLWGYMRKRAGKGSFTWRKSCSQLIALELMALAVGYFEPQVESVSSGPRMTKGMLCLVGLVVYCGVTFILKRLWKGDK